MRRALAGVILLLVAIPALAETAPHGVVTPPPGGIATTPGGSLVISSQICLALGIEPGVPSADYQPGVDVNGKAVAPADLPNAPPPLSIDNFPIEIKKDLAGSFGVPASGGAYGAKAILGYVTIRDNRAYFNGQPLGEDQRSALTEACRTANPAR